MSILSELQIVFLAYIFTLIAGQSVDNFPTEDVTVVLGGTAQLSCTPTVNGARTTVAWFISPPNGGGDIIIINNQTVLGTTVFVGNEYRSPLVFTNASRELDGAIVGCLYDDGVNGIVQPQQSRPTVTVLSPPKITSAVTTSSSVEGKTFTFSFSVDGVLDLDLANFTVSRNGKTILLTGGRFSVDLTSLTISNVIRNDRGNYTITVTTLAGSYSVSFYLDVYYVAEFTEVKRMEEIEQGNTFTFNCTPSAANPPPSSYVFERDGVEITEGVSGSILTVSPLNRSEDSGNYTCMATNEAGSVTIATHLNVLGPPSVPQDITSDDVGPFSVTLSWEAPSDDGGTSQPLSYTVRVINDTVNLSFITTLTQLNLTMDDEIWHNSMYSVRVVADNEYGVSPPAASTFTTPHSVPIIESVSVEALSLTILSVDVVLLTDGGQNVTNYTIIITGCNYTFQMSVPSTKLTPYILNVHNLIEGENYSFIVTATNSVGVSAPFKTSFTRTLCTCTCPTTTSITGTVAGSFGGLTIGVILGILISVFIFVCHHRHLCGAKHVPSSKSGSAPVTYEECEMKNVVDMQHNPSYAVPSQVTGSTGKEGQDKMVDKKRKHHCL